MKLLLIVLSLWSAGCGLYYGAVDNSEPALLIGLSLAGLLWFVALILTLRDLPLRRRRRTR
jgi:hypothetical protein